MPCYLFTWHAYGSWMPDRPRGYVKKNEGVLPPSSKMADRYRADQKESTAVFDRNVQRIVITTSKEAVIPLDATLHYVATDPTHVHILVSW